MTGDAGWLSGTTHTFKWSQIDTISKNSLMISLSKDPEDKEFETKRDILGRKL